MNQIERARAQERDDLLGKLKRDIAVNSDIVAAWLHGSIGRKQHDGWSDIDVWIVLRDEAASSAFQKRREEVGRLGEPVLLFESTYNSPPGGVYLMAGYDYPLGIQLIDWTWQTHAEARAPENVEMLVSKGSLSREPKSEASPADVWRPTPEEKAANSGILAWAMIAIQAKTILRKPEEVGMGFQRFIERLAAEAMGIEPENFDFGDADTIQGAAVKFERLERIASELSRLLPAQASPSDSVGRFLSTAKRAIS